MPQPTNHIVQFMVNGNDITYSDENKVVHSGDTLSFTAAYDFAVSFESGKSPFTPDTPYQTATANNYTPALTIKRATLKKKCKYVVAVYVGGSSPILIEDPQIIIDNNSGGGGGGKKKGKKKAGKAKKGAARRGRARK